MSVAVIDIQSYMKKKGPEFLGIGGQRCGSTWLWKQLRQHPEIMMPGMKEFHYFDDHNNRLPHFLNIILNGPNKQKSKNRLKYSGESSLFWKMRFFLLPRSDLWYRSFFRHGSGQISGEITPEYAILDDTVIKHIHGLNPKIKIIFIMRSPIARAISAYSLFHQSLSPAKFYHQTMMKLERKYIKNKDRFHVTNNDLVSFPQTILVEEDKKEGIRVRDKFLRWLETKDENYRLNFEEFQLFYFPCTLSKKGNYIKSLNNWEKYFSSDQLYLDFFDNVVNTPEDFLHNIFSFLGVDPQFKTKDVYSKANAIPDKAIPYPRLKRAIAISHLPIIESLHGRFQNTITKSWLVNAKAMITS